MMGSGESPLARAVVDSPPGTPGGWGGREGVCEFVVSRLPFVRFAGASMPGLRAGVKGELALRLAFDAFYAAA